MANFDYSGAFANYNNTVSIAHNKVAVGSSPIKTAPLKKDVFVSSQSAKKPRVPFFTARNDTQASLRPNERNDLARYYRLSKLDEDAEEKAIIENIKSIKFQTATPEVYEKYGKILADIDSSLKAIQANEPKLSLPEKLFDFAIDVPPSRQDELIEILQELYDCTPQEYLSKPIEEQVELWNKNVGQYFHCKHTKNAVNVVKDKISAHEALLEEHYTGAILEDKTFSEIDFDEMPISMLNSFVAKILTNSVKLPQKLQDLFLNTFAQKNLALAQQKGVKLIEFATIENMFRKMLADTDLEKMYGELEVGRYIADATEKYSNVTWGHYSNNTDNVMADGFNLSYCQHMNNRWGTAVYAGEAGSSAMDMYRIDGDMVKFKLKDGTKIGFIENPGETLNIIDNLFNNKILHEIDKYAIEQRLSNESYTGLVALAKAEMYKKAGYDAVYIDDSTIGIGIFDPNNIEIIK